MGAHCHLGKNGAQGKYWNTNLAAMMDLRIRNHRAGVYKTSLGTGIRERLLVLLRRQTRTAGLAATTHFKVHRLLLRMHMTTTGVVQGSVAAHKKQQDQAALSSRRYHLTETTGGKDAVTMMTTAPATSFLSLLCRTGAREARH